MQSWEKKLYDSQLCILEFLSIYRMSMRDIFGIVCRKETGAIREKRKNDVKRYNYCHGESPVCLFVKIHKVFKYYYYETITCIIFNSSSLIDKSLQVNG